MMDLKGLANVLSAASGIQNLLAPPRDASLTTVLYHSFFFRGESRSKGRERLVRQLDWLRRKYTPLNLSDAVSALATGNLPKYPLLITADDASTDLLEVEVVFKAFEMPLAVFVVAGWSAQAGELEQESLLARVVAAIEWYEGPETVIKLEGGSPSLNIGRATRTETIERLLASPGEYHSHLEQLALRLQRLNAKEGRTAICTWRELGELQRNGMQFGCHSVSHIPLASASRRRIAFEMAEAKHLMETKFGECSVFAYPYGVEGTFSDKTTEELKNSGFKFAFLTHADYANGGTDPFHLPRFALPNRDMSIAEFRARVMGGGIALRKLGRLFKMHRS